MNQVVTHCHVYNAGHGTGTPAKVNANSSLSEGSVGLSSSPCMPKRVLWANLSCTMTQEEGSGG